MRRPILSFFYFEDVSSPIVKRNYKLLFSGSLNKLVIFKDNKYKICSIEIDLIDNRISQKITCAKTNNNINTERSMIWKENYGF